MKIILKKLLNKNRVIRYWLFFNSGFNYIFKVNIFFYSLGYDNGCLMDLFQIVNSLKKLVPMFFSVSKVCGFFVFVASKFIYANSVHDIKSVIHTKKITYQTPSFISNFTQACKTDLHTLDYKYNPSGVIFFSIINNTCLLEATKLKNIPTIGLISGKTNAGLVDYSLCINSIYFHSVYFFIIFFFKLVVVGK